MAVLKRSKVLWLVGNFLYIHLKGDTNECIYPLLWWHDHTFNHITNINDIFMCIKGSHDFNVIIFVCVTMTIIA